MWRELWLAAALAMMAGTAAAQPAGRAGSKEEPATPTLSLERVFGSPAISGPTPRALKLSPDGRYAALLKPRAEDRERFDLWAIDTGTGAEAMVVDSLALGSGAALSEEEKMRRERARLAGAKGIVSYEWSADSRALFVPLDGDLYLAPLEGAPRRLTRTPETELDAKLSETGAYVSFVRGGNLFVVGTVSGRETQLTDDASATLSWGSAEFIAQEELDRDEGHWWSPDDRRIAVARVDESGVGVIERAAIGAEGTRVFSQRYPRAGTPNARVDLFVMRPDGSGRVQVDLGPDADIYLARVQWSPDGRTLFVQRLSRDQKRLDLMAADPATGATRLVLTETAKTFVNLVSDGFGQRGPAGMRMLPDGSFLWLSERDGFQHLYRVSPEGAAAQLTRGAWVVSGLVGVDMKRGRALVLGNRDTPLERHLYAVPITREGRPERLTPPGGWHGAVVDEAAERMIVTRSAPTQPQQVWLADGGGRRLRWIEENRVAGAHPMAPFAAALTEPEYGTLAAADGQAMHYQLLRPAGPGPHPAVVIVYGGPHVQRVSRSWVPPIERWLVAQGWAVFKLDNRGTYNRGKAFEDPIYQNMGVVEVADQLAGLAWLKAARGIDPERVVLTGWSYGGYMTLKLMAAAPGAFAGGAAGAPVTQWDLYDTAYTERYLGDPRQVPQVYSRADVLPEAAKLNDPLLVIHGMADDNVIFEHSTRLFGLMQAAGQPFEMMVYPGQTHAIAGPERNVHLWRTIMDFFTRATRPPPAPAPAP